MRAFILAGGFATRLWPLTERRAKPLLPLAGKPIIGHLIEKIPDDVPVTVSTNKAFGDDFRAWANTLDRPNVEVVVEQTKSDDDKLGALGAVRAWMNDAKIDDDILLLTGDNYVGFSMTAFLSSFKGDALLAAHDIGDLEEAKAFGTVLLAKDGTTVTGFEEKPHEPKTTLVSTGCSILPRATLPVLDEFAKKHPDNVGGIFEELLRRNLPVKAFRFSDPWFDIGSFDAYLEATRALVKGKPLLREGAELANAECEGSVVIGKNSRVAGGLLHNVVVFENCVIEDCVLRDCIVDDDCTIKGKDLHRKMLRRGTRLT